MINFIQYNFNRIIYLLYFLRISSFLFQNIVFLLLGLGGGGGWGMGEERRVGRVGGYFSTTIAQYFIYLNIF